MSRTLKIISSALLLAFSLVSIAPVSPQRHNPSTPEERARVVQIAKALQSDPLSPGGRKDREWLLKWLVEVPDISVTLCPALLGDLGDYKTGYPGAILATMLASQAAFVIDHPGKSKDPEAIYFAAVDGALRAYESVRRTDANFRRPQLDELLQMRDQGKLEEYVRNTAKKCK